MSKKVVVIGVPFDWGAGERGCAGGPAAIRRTELFRGLEAIGLAAADWGDISPPAAKPRPGNPKLKYSPAVLRICGSLAKQAYSAVRENAVCVILGGDHSLAMGSAAGVAKAFAEKKGSIGVIWVDAHGDFNIPRTSPSGNLHGMPLAHLVGLVEGRFKRIAGFAPAIDAQHACLVGIRDLDEGEKLNLRKSGVRVFTMGDIDRRGMAHVAEQAIDSAGQGTSGIHVSFDIDAADPSIAQGVGTPKRGGLTYREAHLLMEIIAQSGRMVSLDMVEVNPLEDSHNTTAVLASELILSALGKRIY